MGTTIVSAAVIDDVIGIVVLTCVLGAGSGEEGGTSIGQVLINTVPVSYTHLDVYKRQFPSPRRRFSTAAKLSTTGSMPLPAT